MWQLFSFLAALSSALEETLDKAAVVGSHTLDTAAATLIRNIIVLGIALCVAFLIQHSLPALIVSPLVIAWGLVYAAQALMWTWFLKHIEVSAAGVSLALVPLVLLPIDLFAQGAHITLAQIVGICVLVLGSIVFFARKGMTGHLPLRRYVGIVTAMLLFDAITIGSEGYLFKEAYAEQPLTPSSFIVSGLLCMCAFLAFILAWRFVRSGGAISFKGSLAYARSSTLAKMADYGTIFFTLQALTIASVSQVAAMKAFQPLTLLLIALAAQQKLNIELREQFSRNALPQKIGAVVLIIIGSLLIR